MELERLFRQFDGASFAQRAQLAAEAAGDATPAELDAALAGLAHAAATVRLGVIELMRAARHRGAIARLHAHADAHAGDERVFAVRALADLAGPEDAPLRADAEAWARSADAFVAAQGARLLAALGPGDAPTRGGLARDAEALFAAARTRDRLAPLAAIEARGPAALAAIARLALAKGDDDLVALVARALIRQAAALPEPAALVPLVEAARRRVGGAPIAVVALDDAALALGGLAHAARLVARLGELTPPTVEALAALLAAQPPATIALHAPGLIAALTGRPALWSALGPPLALAAPALRASAAAELRPCVDRVIAELRAGRDQPPVTVVSAARVLATLAQPGEPLPTHLRRALERIAALAAAQALVALCARLATEAAAHALIAVTRDPLPEAAAAATAAIAAWRSPWIELTAGPPPVLTPRYVAADGAALTRKDERLVLGDVEYALGPDGAPVRVDATAHGACLCCAPPRALVRARGAGLRCPAAWVPYLRDGAQVIREDAHPFGRCPRCDSDRPRVREGTRTVCLACGAGRDVVAPPPGGLPNVPVARDAAALPTPPTLAEFALVSPTIRAAMGANVFVRAHDGDASYNASGIVIARDGDHVAILTNRHVVESDDQARLCRLEAMTVAGEVHELRTVWRAARGIDLALIEGRVADAGHLAVMPLGGGAALVGAQVFAIGNPLGLPWSYSTGTLSAIRDWTSREGLPVRVLQTDTAISPGSSGGGLWHTDGHLLGVISFGHQGGHGSPVQFALSIAAVKDAFARDDLRWRGRRLAELG